MSIILETTFLPGANLPLATPLSTQILAVSSLVAWFQAEAAHVTLSASDIQTFVNRDSGGAVFTAAGAGNRATLTNSQFGDFSGAVFDKLAPDRYDLSGITFAQATPHSMAFIGRLTELTAPPQHLIGRYSSSSARAAIYTNTANLRFVYGSSQVIGPTVTANVPFLVIASYDGASLKISVNGARGVDVAAVGVPSTVALTMGASASSADPMGGAMAEAWLFSSDIHAEPATLSLIKGWARAVYGIDVI